MTIETTTRATDRHKADLPHNPHARDGYARRRVEAEVNLTNGKADPNVALSIYKANGDRAGGLSLGAHELDAAGDFLKALHEKLRGG